MRMTFGRYMAKNSIIHRMDPRLKLFMIICLIVAVFFPVGFTGLTALAVIILLLFSMSKLNWSMLLKLFRPIFFIFFVLILINVLMLNPTSGSDEHFNWVAISGGGEYAKIDEYGWVVHWKFLWISEKSAYKAIYMAYRIFLMITLTTILTGTTQPLELTLAIEDLLWPLKIIKLPVTTFSQIISIALRMIPTLIDEAGRIMKAQSSRGIDFKNGKIKDKIKAMISLIIPLLFSAFNKAIDLANAMDARGYDPHGKRTRYRQFPFRFFDVIIFIFGVGIAATIFCYPYISELNQFQMPRIDGLLDLKLKK